MGTYPGVDIKSVTNIPITPNMRATVAAGDVTSARKVSFGLVSVGLGTGWEHTQVVI